MIRRGLLMLTLAAGCAIPFVPTFADADKHLQDQAMDNHWKQLEAYRQDWAACLVEHQQPPSPMGVGIAPMDDKKYNHKAVAPKDDPKCVAAQKHYLKHFSAGPNGPAATPRFKGEGQ